MKKTVGEKIELIRGKSTRDEFGQKVDLSSSTLRNIERRGSEPGYDILKRITNHKDYYPYTLWLMTDKTAPEIGQYQPGYELETESTEFTGDDLDLMQVVIEAIETKLSQLPEKQRQDLFPPAKVAKVIRYVMEQIQEERAKDTNIDMTNVIALKTQQVLDLVA